MFIQMVEYDETIFLTFYLFFNKTVKGQCLCRVFYYCFCPYWDNFPLLAARTVVDGKTSQTGESFYCLLLCLSVLVTTAFSVSWMGVKRTDSVAKMSPMGSKKKKYLAEILTLLHPIQNKNKNKWVDLSLMNTCV